MSAQLDIFDTFDLPAGRARRDAGMKSVAENAGEYWRERYRELVTRWFESRPAGSTFTSESMRTTARAHGLPNPHHFNAWSAMAGALLRGWLKTGAIEIHGEGQAKRPQAHATKTVIYRKVSA